MTTQDIVQKLWHLCHVLRDDGVTYHQYVTELTYLLFLKMAQETETEKNLPKGYRWGDLKKLEGVDQLDFYRRQLLALGTGKTVSESGKEKKVRVSSRIKTICSASPFSVMGSALGAVTSGSSGSMGMPMSIPNSAIRRAVC